MFDIELQKRDILSSNVEDFDLEQPKHRYEVQKEIFESGLDRFCTRTRDMLSQAVLLDLGND